MDYSSQRRQAAESPPNKELSKGKVQDHPQKSNSANKVIKSLPQTQIGVTDPNYSGNRSHDNDQGMPPSGTQPSKISVESREGRPSFERQLTPGAADKGVTRQDEHRRASDSGGEEFDNEAMLDEDVIEPTTNRSQNEREDDQDDMQGGLNPEQTLNLQEQDLESLKKLLVKNNLPLNNPVLIVEVLVNRQAQSDEDQDAQAMKFTLGKEDLMEVFGQFGQVVDVELFDDNECAYVTFKDFFEAWYAQQSLNGWYLANVGVNLLVKWLPQSQQQIVPGAQATGNDANQYSLQRKGSGSFEQMSIDKPEFQPNVSSGVSAQQTRPHSSQGIEVPTAATAQSNTFLSTGSAMVSVMPTKFEQENIHTGFSSQMQASSSNFVPSQSHGMQGVLSQQSQNVFQPQGTSNDGDMGGLNNSQDSQVKYTCRYDIQIPNEREFQVARRLIGTKGCNMKRIISQCSKNMPQVPEVVKLRLRGKGSGFKEGPKQEESKEPLHLCISSRFYNEYMLACQQIEQLLLNVYEEFKKHCERHRKDIKPTNGSGILQIKKFETVTGRKTQTQPLHNTYPSNPVTQTSSSQANQNLASGTSAAQFSANSGVFKPNAAIETPSFVPSGGTQQTMPASSTVTSENLTFGHFVPLSSSTAYNMPMPASSSYSAQSNPFQQQMQMYLSSDRDQQYHSNNAQQP